jgi:hypothetical protein
MRQLLVILLFTIISATGFSQKGKFGANIQALKIAYITRELNLSADEAQKFWPVYYTYFDELKKARLETTDDVIAFEEKALTIKKKYIYEFKKILTTDERANKVFLVDRNFAALVRKEIMNRQKKFNR